MGSCSSDDPNVNSNNSNNTNGDTKAIDSSVGGLVWVRRRNGSWWPGRIMGLDEISEGSLVSPRSGTPVKLLGREDASVDWYNLEKSKRVKAFRCGEYDECIEKAKASAANGSKKAVKYARREDAILHALEIENARLGKNQLDFFCRTDNSGEGHGSSAKESPSTSLSGKEDEDATEESESEDVSASASEPEPEPEPGSGLDSDPASDSDSDLAPELSQSGISFEEPNHIGASKVQSVQGKRRRTPNDSEDDGTEGIKRMRGLEDLGMAVGDSNTGNCMSNGSPVNAGRVCNSSLKRKRSQVSNVQEFLKRKNRRRPLTKVMESTAMVSVPIICDQLPSSSGSPLRGLSDGKVSGMESNESRKSFCMVINNNSDSAGVSSENGASLNPSEHAYDASHNDCKLKEKDISDITRLAENDPSDKLFDVPFVAEEKRSTGFFPSGRHEVGGVGRQSSQSSQAEAVSLKIEGFNECVSASSAAAHANIVSPRMEKGTSKWQLKGKRNSRHASKNRKQDSRKYMDMDDESNTYLAGVEHVDGFLQGSDKKVDCDGTRSSVPSHNCDLQVKPKSSSENQVESWGKSISNRESHVRGTSNVSLPPQRSLPYRQSRFTVNSRYQTSDFPGRNFCSFSKLFDVKLEVKANYRPQHVPLVSLMSKLNGKAIVGHPLPVELLNDGYCNRLISSHECGATNETLLEDPELGYASMRNLEAGSSAKHMTMQPCFPSSKSYKSRKSGLLSKKTRKLSSLTGGKKEDRKPAVEKPKGPVIACIPLKLVFSRINEAVNGSARQTHRALTSSN